MEALRSHLGSAHSAVRWANDDPDALAAARRRVQLAKTGLGERGPRWWDEHEPDRIRRARDALAALDREQRE